GGNTTVKSPTLTVPPRSPITAVVVVVDDDPSKSPSTCAGSLLVPIALSDLEGATGWVGMLEQPARASENDRPSTRFQEMRMRRDIVPFLLRCRSMSCRDGVPGGCVRGVDSA